MKQATNPIIVDKILIETARDYGYCIHYDENTKMMCFITVVEVDSYLINNSIDYKLEVKMLFGFLGDKYKFYFLLPNNEENSTYKAHFVSTYDKKTIAKS